MPNYYYFDKSIVTQTDGNSAQWKAAFCWGDHAQVGYLTSGDLIGIGAGNVEGSGQPGYLAYWTDTGIISYDSGIYWDSGNNTLVVNDAITVPTGNVHYIFFNTGVGDLDLLPGQINWNNEAGTLELGLTQDLKIQVGQSTLFRVKNQTGNTLSKGQAAYASGVLGGGQVILAAPFVADESVDEVRFIGLVTDDITNGGDGFVNHFGHIKNVDLRTSNTAVNPNGETWAVGDILFVDDGTPGGLTKVPPKDDIYVALVLADGQNGELFVRITDLHQWSEALLKVAP